MRHRKSGAKLGRTSSHRNAMFRNMVTSLLKYDRIQTTDVKAKELRGWADHVITLAKRGDLHARRQVLSIVREKAIVHKLFDEASERYGNISGGYTRIVKLGHRPGDSAPVSLIELVEAGKRKIRQVVPKQKEAAVSETKETELKKAEPVEIEKPEIKGTEAVKIEKKAEAETPVPVEPEEIKDNQDLQEKKAIDTDDTK
ncbi:50S ribosomal protein L17 [Desulfonema limicola]|uniref:Large ribosomal subunit protein bL17 n=1 Tax=Desulfonema limicola TaxID=45656 RepID=A0A975B4X4_9BACT|nr:50S ribosomal protein L17 [Desulfonema limicola]